MAGKSEFQFLVCFFTRLYIIIFCACLGKVSFQFMYQLDQSYQTNRQPTLPSPFAHTHTLTGSNANTHTHMLTLTGTRGHPKSSCLPAACQFINVVCVHARNVCMCVCVYTSFSHVHTHTKMFAHIHRRTHAQTEAQTLRNTKIVIFTFYADAGLFSRMQLKNLLRSPLTILHSMFIPASALLRIRTQLYSYFSSST